MSDLKFKLNTGAEIPAVGLGTWQSKPGEVQNAVSYALQNGYKLIDGAYCYGNEDEVGEGLKEAFSNGVKREDVFVVSKVWATYNTRVAEGLDKSLKSLGLEYVDLYLIHWPLLLNPQGKVFGVIPIGAIISGLIRVGSNTNPCLVGNDDKFPKKADGSRDIITGWDHVEAWKQMEDVFASGKAKAIGVCNYSKKYLEQLLPRAKVIPAVNQIENHPCLPQQEIVHLCREKGIHVMAYSPLGSTGGPVMSAEPVVKLAEKKGVSASTILLSYHVARGNTVLAKSVTPARIKANLDIVKLGADELKSLTDYSDDLAKKGELKRYVYPPFGIDFGFPDKQ
ncbi:H/ACA snoRNP pseudouridylase subunit [Epichloe festucae Fl1]|uniref:H/ACA snoRNP pseudouridylase subunit n=1 Tax=Epichloe festucae (strain Fl1) TaxID=877507 RepID=A0A7S9KJT5_EPIFF|nr:H/ACA snoRNP pseudouridylase subunit [Epichloe festucae Fl1]